MTDSTEAVSQELDDILLDDLVEVQERTPGTEEPNLTPGQAVYDERRQNIIEAETTRVSGELDLSESTQQMAVSLFEQYAEQEDITGNALEVLAVACLYTACKVESVPLSPDDFANVSETAFTRVILLRRVKSIASTLGLDPRAFLDPTQYIDHYCEDLGLDDEVAERAHEILTIADEAAIGSGKSPTGRAAAAIYNACLELDRKVTQTEIGNTADVTEVTIRNRYQDQRELLTSSSTSSESKSNAEPGLEPEAEIDKSVDSSPETATEPLDQEVSDFSPYVGEAVAENLVSALKQLEQADESLVKACTETCKKAGGSGDLDELEADDVSLALAIIRQASMDLGHPISYPKLKRTHREHEEKIYRVTSDLDEAL
ncbi:transcription initiation factor IIB family protein [Salinadaptatus halalkaliphilus]|uniref:Transcription initiation factor IIB family protein n=1 Tax=Salinadaptatus halalkaliphilus TaxID=2419781 RepID=A0A4S3TSS4_9EURY|nr:transcription initiation factor IIB family protein [Salinadaptatus halalkaliphilus]THE66475.1 transcription initiation factor IIB family protein [Salinadaptatus halalkaliphilus]